MIPLHDMAPMARAAIAELVNMLGRERCPIVRASLSERIEGLRAVEANFKEGHASGGTDGA